MLAAAGCHSKPTDLKATGSPVGNVESKVHVIVTFSRAMVAPDKVLEPIVGPLPLTIDPPFEAQDAMWSTDRTVVITPKNALPVSTRYVVTVPESTIALDGNALPDATTFEFVNERLSASFDVLGSADRAARDQAVRVSFSQAIPLDQVLAHCKYTAGSETVALKQGPESPSGPARSYTFVPSTPLTLDTAYVLACDTTLRGAIGNVGFEAAAEQKVHTYGPLRFVKLEPAAKEIIPDENLHLSIEFTNPLKAPYQMTLTPAVQGFPEQCHDLDEDKPGLRCGVLLDAQTDYVLAIDGKQADTFDQTLGAPQTFKFHTLDAAPSVSMETGYFIAELKRPVLPVWTRNVSTLKVTAVPITQDNFQQLRPLLSWWDNKAADLSKTKLRPVAKSITVTAAKNKWAQQPLGAAELFGGTPGPGMFYLEIGSPDVKGDRYADGAVDKVLVNFTDIGVVSKLSGSRGLVWATRLSTGKPLPGATVTVRDDAGKVKFTATTDADGIALLPGTEQLEGPKAAAPAKTADGLDAAGEHYDQERGGAGATPGDLSTFRIFVQAKDDWTMINPTRSGGLSPWNFNVSVDDDRSPIQLRGFMHTDRGLYRPGEQVHVKGLARVTKLGAPLDVPGEGKPVTVTVTGPQGKTFVTTTAKLSSFGGFWFDIDLPGDARLGDYQISAQLEHGSFTREFTVEEYRPATFEVTGKMKQASLVREGTLKGTLSAGYFYGSPVRAGDVAVEVHSRRRYVHFPGYDEFRFGDSRSQSGSYGESEASQFLVTEDHLTLDNKGNAELSVAVTPNDVAHDADLLISATVSSPSNEAETKSFTVPYFASRTYFGVKTPESFIDVATPQKIQVVAVGADGKPTKAPAKVTVERHDWNCVWEDWGYRGNYQCKESVKSIFTTTLKLDGGTPGEFEFTPTGGGEYWVVVAGTSDKQEASTSSTELYAYGDGGGNWKSSDTMTLDIVADKASYNVGDTATLLLKTDLSQASGLVTIERDGVIEKRMITVTPKVKHLTIPITGAYAPNVYVSIALVQGRIGTGSRGKPRMRMGVIELPVRPDDNKLTVSVETDKKDYRPGEQVTASVKVTDASGAPVSSEVSIAASDEGVLSLLGYQTPDPIPTFYAAWGLGVSTATQLEYIRDIPGANEERPAFGGDAVGTVRSRFVSTAVWTPNAITDATGVATVKFVAPDNLTAFRVMALAADKGHRFGSADQRFTVSKPLQMLASLPRFLDVGDQLEGGVIVHNDTGHAGTATVKMTHDAHVTSTGDSTVTIDVPKDARVPVLFHLTAADVGTAVLTFSVTMDADSDALEQKLPIRDPSSDRTTLIVGASTKSPTLVNVAPPANIVPGSASFSVSVDPDGLAGIEQGLRDLVHYPYGCLEQTTSQLIPMLAARDLADTLAIDGLTGPALDSYVNAGVTKIGLHQSSYGGFSLWPGGESDPYYTAYALWGLSFAKQGGYRVDQQRVDDGLDYLRNDGQNPDASRPHYNAQGNRGSQAFALYVRALWGDKAATAAATTLFADEAGLPVYGKAFLARALAVGLGPKDPSVGKLVDELATQAAIAVTNNALIEEPQQRDLWSYMSSPLRTTSIVMLALVELDPTNKVIPGLVHVVMKHRREYFYDSTQDDMYALLALTAYARAVATGSTSVAVKLDGKDLISGVLAGKQRIKVASAPLASPTKLSITPTGGEVHYAVSVSYRQTLAGLVAESKGIKLTQEYLDEAGKPKSSFQVGDVVRIRVTSSFDNDADHLMVSVALPAGFEAINDRFVQSKLPGVDSTLQTEWGTYSEIFDERVAFASEYSSRGSYVHEFLARATSVGKFIRPPTIAQLMYQPAITARTAADIIEVKAK